MNGNHAIPANNAARFINEFLRLNRNSKYDRGYAIANALRELARRNDGQFSIEETNTDGEFILPDPAQPQVG
jgi:hypothetical protein